MGLEPRGASDHRVGEALCLADPEGNGIEVCADRPAAARRDGSGVIGMPTEPLDLADLAAAGGDASPARLPQGTEMGHLHLAVGAVAPAERLAVDVLGMEVTHRHPGGGFLSVGGHHQLAADVWTSRGAAPGMAGLHGYALVLPDPAERDAPLDRATAAGLAVAPVALKDPGAPGSRWRPDLASGRVMGHRGVSAPRGLAERRSR